MAIKVTDPGVGARRFTQRGQAAAQDYTEGVRAAGDDWQRETAASVENYNQGVQQAIARNAFARGVQEAGAAKFAQKASTVGAQRFPQGIAAAGPAWQEGARPYLDTLAALTLPPRRPKGDPANALRVAAVMDALRRRKVGG